MTRLRNRLRDGARAGALPALLGVAAAAGQAPLSLWWLAVPALGVLVWRLAGDMPARARLWQGWCAGAGYFAAALFWIVEPFMVDAAQDGWMAPFALVLMAGGMALFWLIGPALAASGSGRAGRALLLTGGLAAGDLLRSYIFTGFPWALFGHVWISTPVAQAAAFVGPVGLSCLTLALAALPALAGLRAGTAAALALLGVVWGGGVLRLSVPEPVRDPAIRVRLIQPNATQSLKWQPGMWDVFLDRQMTASAAPAEKPLDLVVWPETAVPWDLDQSADLLREIVAATGGVPVALGIQRSVGARYYNSLAVTNPDGTVRAVYDKHHLVPFGEYVPFGDLLADFGITAFAAREGAGYSPGAGAAILDLGRAGQVLPLICYEAVFPQDLRAAPGRADWILQVTNDGWFGNLAGPWQHLAQARLRAIEQGLPLFRDANTGVTAVVDAHGRVLQSLPLNTEGFLDSDVPAALPATIYARTGDWPATILIALWVLVPAAFRRRNSG